jgi:4-aminobutyrate aminotransferase-like enzyme
LIIPPLVINEAQLKEGFEVLDEALKITDRTLDG